MYLLLLCIVCVLDIIQLFTPLIVFKVSTLIVLHIYKLNKKINAKQYSKISMVEFVSVNGRICR
jgi:hypothetical protein